MFSQTSVILSTGVRPSGLHLGGASRGVYEGGLHPSGLQMAAPLPQKYAPHRKYAPPEDRRLKGGWYASYWNAYFSEI